MDAFEEYKDVWNKILNEEEQAIFTRWLENGSQGKYPRKVWLRFRKQPFYTRYVIKYWEKKAGF